MRANQHRLGKKKGGVMPSTALMDVTLSVFPE
jgi:hypothetical protein